MQGPTPKTRVNTGELTLTAALEAKNAGVATPEQEKVAAQQPEPALELTPQDLIMAIRAAAEAAGKIIVGGLDKVTNMEFLEGFLATVSAGKVSEVALDSGIVALSGPQIEVAQKNAGVDDVASLSALPADQLKALVIPTLEQDSLVSTFVLDHGLKPDPNAAMGSTLEQASEGMDAVFGVSAAPRPPGAVFIGAKIQEAEPACDNDNPRTPFQMNPNPLHRQD